MLTLSSSWASWLRNGPKADKDLGVPESVLDLILLRYDGLPKQTNIPTLQNLAPDVRGNGTFETPIRGNSVALSASKVYQPNNKYLS